MFSRLYFIRIKSPAKAGLFIRTGGIIKKPFKTTAPTDCGSIYQIRSRLNVQPEAMTPLLRLLLQALFATAKK